MVPKNQYVKVLIDKFQINFEKTEKYLQDQEVQNKISIPFNGFKNETDLKRILVVCHGGFIMETINTFRIRSGKEIRFVNDAKNTSLYVATIKCFQCGGKCELKEDCKMVYDIILFNDASHLEYLIPN